MAQNDIATDDDPVRKNSDVIAEQIDELKEAGTLGETAFSKLFHDARTTSRNRATGVTLQVRVRNGEFEVHDNPVLTRREERLRGTDAWDTMVSLPVRSFMETNVARSDIIRQLRDYHRREAAKEHRQETFNR